MAEESPRPSALRMLAWGCRWSPLADDDEHRETWEVLGLPGCFEDVRIDYWNCFHAGMPQPPVPLLIHGLLRQEGAGVREDLMRVADYLEVECGERRLPPDHLGPVCELYGLAIAREEPVLIEGLRERYLKPWAETALPALADRPAMAMLVRCFVDEL